MSLWVLNVSIRHRNVYIWECESKRNFVTKLLMWVLSTGVVVFFMLMLMLLCFPLLWRALALMWIFSTGTHATPHCLASDGCLPQRETKSWRDRKHFIWPSAFGPTAKIHILQKCTTKGEMYFSASDIQEWFSVLTNIRLRFMCWQGLIFVGKGWYLLTGVDEFVFETSFKIVSRRRRLPHCERELADDDQDIWI